MRKEVYVKNFNDKTYYCGSEDDGYSFIEKWDKDINLAHMFYSVEEAEIFIESQYGRFQIEILYSV